MGTPSFLMVLTGGQYAYQRKYGVLVIPVYEPIKFAYIIYTMYIWRNFQNMNLNTSPGKKRKNIDLPEDTFRALSVLAAANGKNLKAFIEAILNDEARTLKEESIYLEFLSNPDSQEMVFGDEKARFEEWLAL